MESRPGKQPIQLGATMMDTEWIVVAYAIFSLVQAGLLVRWLQPNEDKEFSTFIAFAFWGIVTTVLVAVMFGGGYLWKTWKAGRC